VKFDYSFFEDSLNNLRCLRAYSPDKSYLLEAPKRIFAEVDLGLAPQVMEGEEDDSSQIILTRSYARISNYKNLECVLKNSPPMDFEAFYRVCDEALVTTRTMPIHLWKIDHMIDRISNFRDVYDYPIRFFRFGEYWDMQSLQFGLWQSNPMVSEWSVVIVSTRHRDQDPV
jgi:hypothetical protein